MQEFLEAVMPFLGPLQESLSGRQGALPQGPDALPLPSQVRPPQGPNSPALELVAQEAGEPSA